MSETKPATEARHERVLHAEARITGLAKPVICSNILSIIASLIHHWPLQDKLSDLHNSKILHDIHIIIVKL